MVREDSILVSFFPLNFQCDLVKFALELTPVKIDWAKG